MCVCVCVCVCMYACVCVVCVLCVCACCVCVVCVYVCVCMCVCECVRVCVSVSVCVCVDYLYLANDSALPLSEPYKIVIRGVNPATNFWYDVENVSFFGEISFLLSGIFFLLKSGNFISKLKNNNL